MKRLMKRIMASLAVLFVGAGLIVPAQTAYAADFITFNQTIQDSHGLKTSIFQVNSIYAFCCEAHKTTPSRDMQVSITESHNENLRKVLWYGTKGPGAVLPDNNDGYMITSQAASQALGNGRVHSRYEAWYNAVITYAAPPSGFKAYIATPINSTYQALAFSVYYPEGSAYLTKSSSDVAFSSGFGYSLANAVYGVYKDSACASEVAVLTTGENGVSNTITLDAGTYYVKEKEAPEGYEMNETVYTLVVNSGSTTNLQVTDVPKGRLTLRKESADTSVSAGNKYSLKDAEYTVYSNSACTNVVGTLVTDSRGVTEEIILSAGTYYVKETKSPMGFELDKKVHVVSVAAGQVNTFRVSDVPIQGKLSFLKKSSNPEITNGNSCYSLEGAKFGVYKDAAKTKLVGVLTTNASGKTSELTLPLGKYYVKELEAPKGFALCEDFTVEVVAEGVMKEVIDIPQDDPVSVLLQKVDASTGKPVAVGGANLAGAEYTFKYYDGIYSADPAKDGKTPVRSWVFRTDKDGYIEYTNTYKVSGDEFFTTENGLPTLPLGTITIQETKAPEGYKINPEVYVRTITADGSSDMVNTYNQPITPETVERGDVEFIKINSETKGRMANVRFRLTETTTGESHVLITDENGKASTAASWNKHSNHTNRGERSSDGIWFGLDTEGNMAPVDDKVGALPYGTYKLEELQCEANKGYDLFDPVVFKIDSDEKVVNLGSLENHFVELDTVALDKNTNSHHSHAKGEVTIVDTVYYKGLTAGKTYKLLSKVIDTASGQILSVSGKGAALEKEFSPTASKASVQTSFTFNADSLAGKTVVVTQEIYRNGILISSHIDLDDEDQMVRFPKIGTSAVNAETNEKLVNAEQKIVIEDKVAFENVTPNQHYVLKGKLMNADTGESIKINGKEVTVEKEFRTKKSNGTETVEFVLNDSKLAGQTITIYEVLYDENGEIIASHEVLNDPDQTIYVPKVGTSATDSVTDDHVMKAAKDAVIVDEIKYSGLMPGREYKVSGVLMDKETGKPLMVNGNQVTAVKEFTAADKAGVVEMRFSFDATKLGGKTVIVFEELYFGTTLIASHKDISDEGQTVHIPKISTSAIEKSFDKHVAVPAEKAVITDMVTYKNLLVGKEYKVDGVLMDKATGKALLINGKEVTATKTFTAASADGVVELTFNFDSSALEGTTVVVFETLTYQGKEIAVHKDISDAGQSIYYPAIGTKAMDGTLKEHLGVPKKETVITDTISYTNLPVGEKFTLSGILMDKETSQPLLVEGKEITAECSFKTTESDGEKVLEFKFDSTALEGTSVVVFETLLYDGEEVTTHKDIDDEEQTVHFPKIRTQANEGSFPIGNLAIPNETMTITDTVSFTNLLPGKEYTISGILMNKATGKALLVSDKEVRAEKTFVATEAEGFVELEFKLDASALAGTTVVVFEELLFSNTVVVSHKDLEDAAQTVYIPAIHTNAIDKNAEDHKAIVGENNVIIDTVTYESLVAGKEYTVKGYLVDRATNEPLMADGKKIETEVTFEAETSDGSVKLDFVIPGNIAGGKEVVVFEELYYADTLIAAHKDIEDANQTVKYDYTSVIVNKTDLKTEKGLAGAKLQLIELVKDEESSTDENIVYKEVLVEEWITDGNPYECKNIKNGNYLIREVETPDGYVTCKDLTFEKENAYDEIEFNMKDDIIKVEISKKDAVDKAEIKGAKMQLLDKDGKIVEEWTTDGKVHYIEYLPVGTYTLVEKAAPFGYVLSEPVTFDVKDTGEVQVVEMLDARTQGYIKIEKLSSVNRNPLAGAVFEFKNKDGQVIDTLTTDEKGNAESKRVDIGIYENGEFKDFAVYYLQEVTSPEGYQLDDTVYEIKFGYLGGDVPVVYKNYKIPNVKVVVEEPKPEWELVPTGDSTQYCTYVVLLVAALATTVILLKKRTVKEN